jgi:hypothetical protein
MPLPDAIVTVRILRIASLPSGYLSGATRPYALAKVGNSRVGYFHFGRSQSISTSASSIDFTSEPMRWEHAVAVRTGENVEVEVEIWDDLGDTAPPSSPLRRFRERITAPWQRGRVGPSAGPTLYLDINTQLAQSYIGPLIARSRSRSGASGVVRVRRELFVDLKEILGLYEPGYDPPTPGPHKLAEYHEGYLSHDHRGRIYLNHDLSGNWVKDVQLIQVTAEVTPRGMPLPSDARIRWTVLDPDDPFNDRKECHHEWGSYIDPNDYNATGDPTGARHNDNPRAYSETAAATRAQLFDRDPRWEQEGSHTLTVVSDQAAMTNIDPGTRRSKVKIHCPNVGGTNLIVRAGIQTGSSATVFPAQSGIMSLWKRLDVELLKMEGAHSLQSAVRNVAPFLEPAYVQLDFVAERSLDASHTRDHMANDVGSLSNRTQTWLSRTGVFDHRVDRGWFCLAAARYSLPTASTSVLYDSSASGAAGWHIVRSGESEHIVVDSLVSVTSLAKARFEWQETVGPTTRDVDATFIVGRALRNRPTAGKTTLLIWASDIQHRFTGHNSNGSLTHAYQHRYLFFPQGRFERPAGTWAAPGFGVPNAAGLIVETIGGISGISPSLEVGGVNYFAGRTVVFTYHPRYSRSTSSGTLAPRSDFDDRILGTVVHEFIHAFGMPHKCGYWDYRTPRQKSCVMNYSNTALINPGTGQVQRGTEGQNGPRLCGRHLMEVRRVHVEGNGGLNW